MKSQGASSTPNGGGKGGGNAPEGARRFAAEEYADLTGVVVPLCITRKGRMAMSSAFEAAERRRAQLLLDVTVPTDTN